MPITKMIGAGFCLFLFGNCLGRRLFMNVHEPVSYGIAFAIGVAASAYVFWTAVQEYRVLRSKTL